MPAPISSIVSLQSSAENSQIIQTGPSGATKECKSAGNVSCGLNQSSSYPLTSLWRGFCCCTVNNVYFNFYFKLKFITSYDCIAYGRLNVAIFRFVNIFISVNLLTEPGEIILKWFCLSWRASFSLSKVVFRRPFSQSSLFRMFLVGWKVLCKTFDTHLIQFLFCFFDS